MYSVWSWLCCYHFRTKMFILTLWICICWFKMCFLSLLFNDCGSQHQRWTQVFSHPVIHNLSCTLPQWIGLNQITNWILWKWQTVTSEARSQKTLKLSPWYFPGGPGVKTPCFRASLVAQWLRICLPMQGTRVRALVWEDPICRGATRPLSHNYWACASGACAPNKRGRDNEGPAHHDEEWPPLAATRESPRTETKTQHSHK